MVEMSFGVTIKMGNTGLLMGETAHESETTNNLKIINVVLSCLP